MKKPWVTIVLAAALSLAVAAPVVAASPFVDVSMDKGSSAWGDRGTCMEDVPEVGDSTCENTYAQVFDGWSRYNGERFRGDTLCVGSGMSVYHAATQTFEDTWTSGCLEGADVYVDGGLASAAGAGIVPTESFSCTWDEVSGEGSCTDPVPAGDIAVDLAWSRDSARVQEHIPQPRRVWRLHLYVLLEGPLERGDPERHARWRRDVLRLRADQLRQEPLHLLLSRVTN